MAGGVTSLSVTDVSPWFMYDPETGVVRWRKHASTVARAGRIAGTVRRDGYRQIYLKIGDKKRCLGAHQIAFFLMSGACPIQIDHKNNTRDDNAWDNIRPCTQTQNNQNSLVKSHNKTGFKGVWRNKRGRHYAKITLNGKRHWLGGFSTAQEAHAAYCRAAIKHFGEFANNGTSTPNAVN